MLPSGAKGDNMPYSQGSVPIMEIEQSINGVPLPNTNSGTHEPIKPLPMAVQERI